MCIVSSLLDQADCKIECHMQKEAEMRKLMTSKRKQRWPCVLVTLWTPVLVFMGSTSDSERFPFTFSHQPDFNSSVWAKWLQSCLTLCDPMDCRPQGSSMHGILQSRILESIAVPSSRRFSQPRDRACISYISNIGRQILYHEGHVIFRTILGILEICKRSTEGSHTCCTQFFLLLASYISVVHLLKWVNQYWYGTSFIQISLVIPYRMHIIFGLQTSQVALVAKTPIARAGDARVRGSIPGWGRSSGEWNGTPLHYSCLKSSMGRGAWQATVHGLQTVRYDWAHKSC